jgi:hypothetical protein
MRAAIAENPVCIRFNYLPNETGNVFRYNTNMFSDKALKNRYMLRPVLF